MYACMQLYGVEVGEEMAPTGDDFTTLVDGYRQVHGMLQALWPDNTRVRSCTCGCSMRTVEGYCFVARVDGPLQWYDPRAAHLIQLLEW